MKNRKDRPQPEALLQLFRSFFGDIGNFTEEHKEKNTPERVRFIRDYPEKNLQIIVTTPIKRFESGILGLMHNMHIEFAVHFDKKASACLELRDSRVVDGWKDTSIEKMKVLTMLINDITMCGSCKVFPYPFIDSAPQGKPKSTRFVWLRCPGPCGKKFETTFGTGLKTGLSKYIKKN